jgi:hypothetical protein
MYFLVKRLLYKYKNKFRMIYYYNYIFSFYFNMRNNGEDKYETFMNINKGIEIMNDNIVALKSQTINLQENIEKTKIDPSKIFNELKDKEILLEKNKKIIQEKMKILEGRNRMLQISIDKNIFYKKVVYVILTIVIVIIIIVLFAVSFLKSI